MKKAVCWLIMLALAFTAMIFPASGEAEAARKKLWTVMVYMCGSDLEEGASASRDIMEMLASGFESKEMNVLVMTGGAPKWFIPDIPADEECVWELDPESFYAGANALSEMNAENLLPVIRASMRQAAGEEAASMGAPQTLGAFLRLGYDAYPAERYALILWDHGNGPNQGVCTDQNFDGDMLSLEELGQSLKESPFAEEKLEWIGFDACLMGSVEIAARMAPFARYMVASEETEPGDGWNYDFLQEMKHCRSGAEAGREVVRHFTAHYQKNEAEGKQFRATLACVDLAAMAEVAAASEPLFAELKEALDENSYIQFMQTREAGTFFGHADNAKRSRDYDLIDLGSYVSGLTAGSEDKREALCSAVDRAVVYSESTVAGATGLSIYYPYFNIRMYSYLQESYADISLSEAYNGFIQKSSGLQQKASRMDWAGLGTRALSGQKDMRSLFSLQLKAEQKAMLAEARLQVLQETEGGYALVCDVPEVQETGETLHAEYVHRALFVTDESGKALSAALPFMALGDGQYSVETTLVSHDQAGQEVKRKKALLRMRLADEEGNMTVTEVRGWDEKQGSFTARYSLNAEDFDIWEFRRETREPAAYAGGTLFSWDEWPAAGETTVECHPREGQKLMILHEQIDRKELYAAFALRDYQNNHLLSALTAMAGEAVLRSGETVLRYDDLGTAVLSNPLFSMRDNGTETSATLTMDVRNISGQEACFLMKNVRINGCETNLTASLFGFGANDGLDEGETQRLILPVGTEVLAQFDGITSITFDLIAADPVTAEERTWLTVEMELTVDR